jgi:hypothetical protein
VARDIKEEAMNKAAHHRRQDQAGQDQLHKRSKESVLYGPLLYGADEKFRT